MKKTKRSKLTVWWLVAVSGCLCAVLPVQAQQQAQRQTGGGQARTGGASATGAGSTRQYYPSGVVGEATITGDPETRRLIVITDEETSQYVGQVITNLDRPKPQVLIKVVFLEVAHNDGSDIGFEGSYHKGIGDGSTVALSNLFGLTPGTSGFPNPIPTPPGAGIYQILNQDYTVTLYAIAKAGKTKVLSRPSILTRNNQQATITVGQSVPIVTGTIFSGANAVPVNTITYENVGVILKVTPFITSDGSVEMILAPQISSLSDQTVNVSAGVNVPVINIRSADTVVVTPNGQTVIIGGLMENLKGSVVSKIPFLGDIPGLGALFRRTTKTETKTELIIFLTPHIVSDAKQLAALTDAQQRNSPMVEKAFTEKELNQFLDNLPNAVPPDGVPSGNRKSKSGN